MGGPTFVTLLLAVCFTFCLCHLGGWSRCSGQQWAANDLLVSAPVLLLPRTRAMLQCTALQLPSAHQYGVAPQCHIFMIPFVLSHSISASWSCHELAEAFVLVAMHIQPKIV